MESITELSKGSTNPGFFKHVFNFDEDSKEDMMNIVQYALIAIIPVVILNKSMQKLVPEADDEKPSAVILAEVLAQVIGMFLGILIIHRIITYIPTYSKAKYADFSVTNIILVGLVITLSLQTKLGEKVSILVDRINELWDGPSDDKKKKKKNGNGNVRVSQPISQGQMTQQAAISSQGTTSISQLPVTQPMPDYNNMYQQDTTPLVGAATPGMGMDGSGVMAANEGGAFASPFGLGW
jgi:hypothetical protein